MTKNMKLLFAMIRSPKMCDIVYKAERKRFAHDKLKKLRDDAYQTLR